jgi:hypothetical protein
MRVNRVLFHVTMISLGAAIATLAVVSARAHAHAGHGAGHAPKPTPEELAAFEGARSAFDRHCFRCHTTTGKKSKPKALAHMSMDHYPFGGHHADEAGKAVREVLGAAGKGKATMPRDDPGAVAGDDLAKTLAWADAFDRAHPTESTPAPSADDAGSGGATVYTCPMHPEVTSDKPGRCPKCGMKLVPKKPASPEGKK